MTHQPVAPTHQRTFQALWNASCRNHPARPFLVFRDEDGTISEWTYDGFDALVAQTAGMLHRFGVGPGDAVHLCLRNSPAFVLVWLATVRLGAWMVPVDPASTARDIDNQVRRTAPVVGICASARAAAYREGVGDLLHHIVEVGETAADARPGSPLLAEPAPVAPVRPADRAAIMFTSGTTSEPKGVVLTQHNYWYVATTMAALVNQRPDHRWYVCLPLFHGNAQYYCFAAAIAASASVALTAAFTASGWPFQAAQLGATHASLFAAPVRMILARRRPDAPRLSLQHVWFAQSLGDAHYAEFAEMCGVMPRQLYGMTETTAIVTADLRPAPGNDTIGAVIPGRQARLLDPVTGEPVPSGSPGVLTVAGVRGEDLFAEYLNNPAANAKAFPKFDEEAPHAGAARSWLSTGDLVRARADGMLEFVGRIDDVVKVAGENVSLTEIEAALAQAPGVLEAAVLAVDDPVRDKVPVAYVVPRDPERPPTAASLTQWADSHLAPARRPRGWTVIDELPRTSVGKVRRFKLDRPPGTTG